MALITKRWILTFFISLSVTFLAGFFVWDDATTLANNFTIFLRASLQSENEEQIEMEDFSEPDAGEEIEPGEEPGNLALFFDQAPDVQSIQDLLDDIAEKLDIIQQQVNELVAQKEELQEEEENEEDSEEEEEEKNLDEKENNACLAGVNINSASAEDLEEITDVGPVTAQKIISARPFYLLDDLLKVAGIGEKTLQKIKEQACAYVEPGLVPPPSQGGGGGSSPVYPKILISEIQIAPINQRFIELYNPSSVEVSLTGWYLQRKTKTADSWASFVSSTRFEGKIIAANSYFLISRELDNSDVLLDITLSSDNSLVFKNPNGEVSDLLGFGLASDFELMSTINPPDGQSMGRKVLESGTEQETDDNSSDFEIQNPTPKAQNVAYVEPPPPPSPELLSIEITSPATKLAYFIGEPLDISGLEVTGSYGDGASQVLLITQDNITGFDSSSPSDTQTLTITFEEKTTTYDITITESPEPVITKNIMINEIQILPLEKRFIELYNPNSFDVGLTGYYLQRKTKTSSSWNSLVSSTNFEGKTILAGGYFLISRELADTDITLDITLSSDNSLVLKNSDREIVDQVGWGEAQEFEAAPAPNPEEEKSISRTGGADTDDNSLDFAVLEAPTPKFPP